MQILIYYVQLFIFDKMKRLTRVNLLALAGQVPVLDEKEQRQILGGTDDSNGIPTPTATTTGVVIPEPYAPSTEETTPGTTSTAPTTTPSTSTATSDICDPIVTSPVPTTTTATTTTTTSTGSIDASTLTGDMESAIMDIFNSSSGDTHYSVNDDITSSTDNDKTIDGGTLDQVTVFGSKNPNIKQGDTQTISEYLNSMEGKGLDQLIQQSLDNVLSSLNKKIGPPIEAYMKYIQQELNDIKINILLELWDKGYESKQLIHLETYDNVDKQLIELRVYNANSGKLITTRSMNVLGYWEDTRWNTLNQ